MPLSRPKKPYCWRSKKRESSRGFAMLSKRIDKCLIRHAGGFRLLACASIITLFMSCLFKHIATNAQPRPLHPVARLIPSRQPEVCESKQ
ncbi:hypothetical protein BJY00DRAFT_190173 [Aspergillus carlsbadensis]|nr:hypothetical protein BJY00DRAFT_190173 [Aspergillus carlsbadensis]